MPQPPPGPRLLLLALLLPLADAATPAPARALALYRASGGLVDGSLGGIPFNRAEWTVEATADPALVQVGAVLGVNPIRFLPVQPTLTLRQAGGVLVASLLSAAPLQWSVYSLDLGRARPGLSVNGFGLLDLRDPAFIPDGFPDALAVAVAAGGFNDLAPVLHRIGSSDTRTNAVLSDQGPLRIEANSRGPGRFAVTAAPGPLPLAGLGLALGWSRSLRRRLALRPR
ncbi:MAG: hypothetical protein VKK62_03080 [Synechococcaceae cyanobacterium]|nr:hypothetical protein [Synechococcaceae cyanobacterium]